VTGDLACPSQPSGR